MGGRQALLVVGKTKGIDLADEQPPKARPPGGGAGRCPHGDLTGELRRAHLWELEDKAPQYRHPPHSGEWAVFAPSMPGIRVNLSPVYASWRLPRVSRSPLAWRTGGTVVPAIDARRNALAARCIVG